MHEDQQLDLNDLILFLQVVEHGGFTAVSRVLGIPKSTISQRIAALESAAGTGLLRRTSRSQSLTEAGELLLPYARSIARDAKAAQRDIASIGSGLAGTLRISSSVAIAQYAVGPIIPKFLADNPRVNVRMDASNRYVDLVGEGYDLVLRAHASDLKDSGLEQQILAKTPWVLSASPRWLDENQEIHAPHELSTVATLFFRATEGTPSWKFVKDGAEQFVKLNPRVCTDDMSVLMTAAIGGVGVVALPLYICGPSISAGNLRQILPGWDVFTSQITALTPPKSQSSRLTRAFTDFLSLELAPYIASRKS